MDPALTQLLETAESVCDRYGDSEEARSQMRADVKATPEHLRQDLLEHFHTLVRPMPLPQKDPKGLNDRNPQPAYR